MASQAQIAANRANALKSTGPTSVSGKRRIASNGLKHGLYSDTRINLFSEDNNFVNTLLTDLQAEYRPVTPTEHILVQQLATLQTRFLRAQSHYLALIDRQAESMYLDLKEKFVVDPDTDTRYALAFEKQSQSNRALEILSREIDRLPNKIRKTIEMLVWYRQVPAAGTRRNGGTKPNRERHAQTNQTAGLPGPRCRHHARRIQPRHHRGGRAPRPPHPPRCKRSNKNLDSKPIPAQQ